MSFPYCNFCKRPAIIEATQLRGRPVMMLLCTRHFWDWNAKSLKRRGLQAGEILQVHVDAGRLDDPPEDP